MRPRIVRRSQKAGLPPGTPVHIGERRAERTRIALLAYDEDDVEERELAAIEELAALRERPGVVWVDVDGLHEVELLQRLGEAFGLHPLVVEDILNTDQRPKIDDYGDYIYVVLRMLDRPPAAGSEISTEQVSLVLGANFVLSFQERAGDVFDPVRERIRGAKGRLRKQGADYLAYALMDAIVDNYFVIIERIEEDVGTLEDELVANPTRQTLHAIHHLRRQMIMLMRSVWPLREVVNDLERGGSPLIKETTGVFLRDVYDHIIHAIDTIETFRDLLSGMLDIYLSSISNRLNEVMKVLTIIATIFMPLTFISSVYGMNFVYMPEIQWRWGYPMVLLVMLGIGVAMLAYFRRQRWL